MERTTITHTLRTPLRVGVLSLRRRLLAQSADCVALGISSSRAAEAFGQSEALTTRLRHIIQDYPEGPGARWRVLCACAHACACVAVCVCVCFCVRARPSPPGCGTSSRTTRRARVRGGACCVRARTRVCVCGCMCVCVFVCERGPHHPAAAHHPGLPGGPGCAVARDVCCVRVCVCVCVVVCVCVGERVRACMCVYKIMCAARPGECRRQPRRQPCHPHNTALAYLPAGVLLELLQNADDAGARRVCFMLDAAQHPTSSVLGPGMQQWQVGACMGCKPRRHGHGGSCCRRLCDALCCESARAHTTRTCTRTHRLTDTQTYRHTQRHAHTHTHTHTHTAIPNAGPCACRVQRCCVLARGLLSHCAHRAGRKDEREHRHRPLWPWLQFGGWAF